MVNWGASAGEYAWLVQNQYAQALFWVIVTVAVAKLFKEICLHCFRKLTKKTKSDIDDVLLELSARPLFFIIVTVGAFLSLRPLDFFVNRPWLLKNVFFVLGTVLIGWMIARVFAFIVTRWFKKHQDLEGSPRLLKIIVSVFVYIAAFIVVLSYFNIEVTPLIAALGVGGLAVGLALQDTLGNIFAGVHIISDQPIRVKDIVEIPSENITGVVEDIGWRSTRIRTFTNNRIIIPNAKLASSIIQNWEMPNRNVRVIVECGVDYTSDLQKVERISLAVAKRLQKHEAAVKDWEPLFRFHTFADNNVNFRVILEAKTRGDKFLLEHEFIKQLHARFEKEGIEISWPIRKLYMMKEQKKAKKPSRKTTQKRTKEEQLFGD